MKNFIKKNWLKILAVCILFGALWDHPYSYYQLTRWFITICSVYLAFHYYENHKTAFMWVFIALAILFNPIFPFYFSKDMWQIFDVIGAVLFFASLFIKTDKK